MGSGWVAGVGLPAGGLSLVLSSELSEVGLGG